MSCHNNHCSVLTCWKHTCTTCLYNRYVGQRTNILVFSSRPLNIFLIKSFIHCLKYHLICARENGDYCVSIDAEFFNRKLISKQRGVWFYFAEIVNLNRSDVHYLLLGDTFSFSRFSSNWFNFSITNLMTDSSRFKSLPFKDSSLFAVFCKTATFGTPLILI